VTLDGKAAGVVTPARLEGVKADRAHALVLTLAGRTGFAQSIPPQTLSKVKIAAALKDSEARASQSGELPDARDPPEETPAAAPAATWPQTRDLLLRAQEQVLVVPATRAARLRLDPARSFSLSLEGSAEASSPDGKRAVRELAWFAERATGTRGEAAFGLVSPDAPVTLSDARAIYLFALLRPEEKGTGTLRAKVLDVASRREQVLEVEIGDHGLAPGSEVPHFTRLDPQARYALSIAGQADLGATGTTGRALAVFDGTGDAAAVLQPARKVSSTARAASGSSSPTTIALTTAVSWWSRCPSAERPLPAGHRFSRCIGFLSPRPWWPRAVSH